MNKNKKFTKTTETGELNDKGKKRFSKRRGSKSESREYAKSKSKDDVFNQGTGIHSISSTNDIEWYAASPALLRDAASLPFSNSLGIELTLGSGGLGNETYQTTTFSPIQTIVPGVMAIRYIPIPGISKNFGGIVNVAARNIYSYVSSSQSGAKNYEAPDLMLYILAMDSVYNMWNYLVRAYGVANTYSQKNRYLPRGILSAMNLDPDSVLRNMNSLRYWIINLAKQIGCRCVPTTFPLIKRHSFMNQFVYSDKDNEKAQCYLFVPEGYHAWNISGTAGDPGTLKFCSLWENENNSPWDVMDIVEIVKDMIFRIVNDDDFDRMSGDIARAYDGKVWKLEEIPETYAVRPIYDEVVSSQIENSIAWGQLLDNEDTEEHVTGFFDSADISQVPDGGYIWCRPRFKFDLRYKCYDKILNAHTDETTPAMIMEWTRLMSMARGADVQPSSTLGEEAVFITTAGTEIVTKYSMYTFQPTMHDFNRYDFQTYEHFNQQTTLGFQMHAGLISKLSCFNRHPIVYVSAGNYNTAYWNSGNTFSHIICDLDNYTSIDWNTISRMHDTAILSELNVPVIGAVNSSVK